MRNWFNIENTAEAVTIDIYGPIGKSWWDDDATDAKSVLDAIRDAGGRPIEIHVNSEGGSVFDAFAIFTAIRNYDGETTAYVDGLAASAASYIIAAADRVEMSDVAWLMIHEASGAVWGNKHELAKEIEVLDGIDQTIAGIYAKKGNQPAEVYAELMEAETWLDAESALGWGLVDEIAEAMPKVARASYDARIMAHVPEAAAAALAAQAESAPERDACANIDETPQADADDGGTAQEGGAETAQEGGAFVAIGGRIYKTSKKEVE